jgi:hypothetical protein
MDWNRKVPVWAFLLGIVMATSITAGLLLVPTLLSPKPDFAVSLDTSSMILTPFGNGNSSQITIRPIRNFTGIVSLKATTFPAGITASFFDNPTNGFQDTVLLGNAATLGLLVVATMQGNYTVNLIASSGSISHTFLLRAAVQNLTMSATPNSQNIARASSSTVKLDLKSVNGFDGNLSLQDNIIINATKYPDPNSFANLPATVILPSGGTVEVVITIQVAQAAQTGYRTVFLEARKGAWNFILTFSFTVV